MLPANKNLKEILEGLRGLKQNGPTCIGVGICGNMADIFRGTGFFPGKWLRSRFPLWEHYSGSTDYPVPAPGAAKLVDPDHEGGDPHEDCYNDCPRSSMWSREEPYGKLRWALLDFLIEQAEKELQSCDQH